MRSEQNREQGQPRRAGQGEPPSRQPMPENNRELFPEGELEPRPQPRQYQQPSSGSPRPPADGAAPHPQPQAKTYRGKKQPQKLNRRHLIIVSSFLVGLLLFSLVLAAVLPSCSAKGDPSSSGSGLVEENTGSMVEESNYNKNENALPVEELQSTILQKTEDAGEEYIKETLFLGDSNTVRMMSYRDITYVSLENSIGVEGMGIQSVPTLQCVQFKGVKGTLTMPEAVAVIQPKRIVITFGTNNAGSMGTEGFIKSYEKALDAIHDKYEYADIIIGAVPPIDKYHINENLSMTTIDKFNVALAELAEAKGYKFLNWTEALKDPNTGFCNKEYTIQDGIHISKAGMEAMFTYFRTHSYIGEDRRPKPLKEVPERIGYNPGIIANDPNKVDGPISRPASSSAASSSKGTAEVIFSVLNEGDKTQSGGTVVMNGAGYTSVSASVEVGGACPTVTAVPNDGFVFAYWACSVGSIGDVSNSTLSGFKVFSTVKPGEQVYVTAVFKPVAVSSAPSAPPPVSSAAPPPSSVAPPPSTLPASSETPVSVTPEPPTPETQIPEPPIPSGEPAQAE